MRPDLHDLAQRHDDESRSTYLSLYADLTKDRYETRLQERAREIRAALDSDAERERFDAALEAATEELNGVRREQPEGAAVFVAPEDDFAAAYPLAAPVETQLVLDSSPYVRPLARFEDHYAPFVLVLLDGERAAVYLVEDAEAEKEGASHLDAMGRHKKGGWSQMRYQRSREQQVQKHLDEVVAKVEGVFREEDVSRLILAGPGQAKRQLADRLPQPLKDALEAVEDVDFGQTSDPQLVHRFVDLARHLEEREDDRKVQALRQALLRGELATTGAHAVARAARNGRVDVLVVEEGRRVAGRKCEAHEGVFGSGETCGACGDPGTEVDVIEEAVEYALRSDAEVEFVEEDPFLHEVGGVGALLRW